MVAFLKETAIAMVLFFLLSLVIDVGGETTRDKIFGAVVFGVIYALVGVVLRMIRSRSK